MITVAGICLLLLGLCIAACIYRIVTGPEVLDRLIAFDLTSILISLSMGILAIIRGTWIYLEISLGLAVLALVATIAIAHFVGRERIF